MEKKIALITGASNGIGKEIARLFAQNNYFVIINYNNSEKSAKSLEQNLLDNGFEAMCIQADVSDSKEVKNMISNIIKNFGHIDVLINNAGIASNKILIDETIENINQIISTNLVGTINCCKYVSEHMMHKGFGKIINISSIWGLYGASGETVYSASKGGIIAFTKALSKELIYSGITVNAIAPGCVDTNMMKNYTEHELDEIKNNIPLKRFAYPEEIASLALYLASNNANYITGQTIQIDGGFCL